MKELKSKKGIPLPKLYLVSDRSKIKEIPKGVPYIYGLEEEEDYLVRILEYEVLYNKAVKTGYPFDFKQILLDQGFEDVEDMAFGGSCKDIRLNLKTRDAITDLESFDKEDLPLLSESSGLFKKFVKDTSMYVDVSVIKSLKIIPTWLDSIEDSISANIHAFSTYDSNMYNKKLEGVYGGMSLQSPSKNLIIIDISGSIPRAVSSTILALAKNLGENFYADLLITGSKSTLYDHQELHTLNVETVYEENGMDNDQVWFRKLVEEKERKYNTCIVFGDHHSPGESWSNEFNIDTKDISARDGKKLCAWKINKVMSFHTTSNNYIAGYADWFEPKEVEMVPNWVKDLRRVEK